MTKQFVTALLGSPFGLTGRVKIESLSGEEKHLIKLQKIILRKDGMEKAYTVEEVFSAPLSLKLKGVDSPEAAKALSGAEILISRNEAAPLSKDEFYFEDLRGMKVYAGGKIQGIISDIIEGGGGFLAEIVLESGEKRLIPFRNEFFGRVDPAAGRVELLHTWILE